MLKFQFDVVGGNPRIINSKAESMRSKCSSPYLIITTLENCLRSFFKQDLPPEYIDWANITILSYLTDDIDNNIKSSFFLEWFTEKDSQGIRRPYTSYASVFLGYFIQELAEKNKIQLTKLIQSLFGSSGLGNVQEFLFHHRILSESTFHILTFENKTSKVTFGKLIKVLVRRIEDLESIQNNQYSLPTISNFPVIDSMALIDGVYYFFQSTIGKSHGLSNHWDNIYQLLKLHDKQVEFIWVLGEDNFIDFPLNQTLLNYNNIRQCKLLNSIQTDGWFNNFISVFVLFYYLI